MTRETQWIMQCAFCNKIFTNGEEYWLDARTNAWCTDNECGWEDSYWTEGNELPSVFINN